MKKYFLVLAAVLALGLSGCAAKGGQGAAAGDPGVVLTHTEAADVILRDGQKWVRVHGAGVEFPLLGEWEEAEVVMDRKPSGEVTTKFVLLESGESMCLFEVGKSDEYIDVSLFRVIIEKEGETEFVKGLCGPDNIRCVDYFFFENGSFFVQCEGRLNSFAGVFLNTSGVTSGVACVGVGNAGAKHIPVFAQMVRRLEHR